MRLESRGRTVQGAPAWDPLLVFCRLRLMAEITARCTLNGRDIPAGYRSCMPEHVREISKMDYAAARPMRPSRPTAAEISLRDATVEMIRHLEEADRVILWGHAVGKSSRRIERYLRDYLRIRLSYRAVQDRFYRLLDDLARYWQGRGIAADDATLVAAESALARQAPHQIRRTPRAPDGITYSRADLAVADVGESRVILVTLPPREYQRRRAQKKPSQASQKTA